jgi:hypothetical protein
MRLRPIWAIGGSRSSVRSSLGQSDQWTDQRTRKVSADNKRAGQRNRARTAPRRLGEVDHSVGRRARLQVRIHAEFG